MKWEEVKTAIRKIGLRHSVLNKNGECETLHVEQTDGNFIRDTHLFKYEPEKWEGDFRRLDIHLYNQLDLFA